MQTEADSNDITEHPHDDKSRPYVCTVCDKRFTTKACLMDHRNKHTGEKLYSCSQCERSFLSRSALYHHRKIHTECMNAQNVENVVSVRKT